MSGYLWGGEYSREWKFVTTDPYASIIAANYFNGSYQFFSRWDIIHVYTTTAGTTSYYRLMVTSVDGRTVVVSPVRDEVLEDVIDSRLNSLSSRITVLENNTGSTQTLYPGLISFQTATRAVNEQSVVYITLTRTQGDDGEITADLAYTGTLTLGVDYTTDLAAGVGAVVFADAELTKTIALTIGNIAGDGTIIMTLSNVNPANSAGQVLVCTANVTAAVSATPGSVRFTASSFSATEPASGSITTPITLIREGGTTGAITASVTLSPVDGTAGVDYVNRTMTFTWADGVGGTKTDTVTVNSNTSKTTDSVVGMQISSVTGGASIGVPSTATLNIDDVDGGGAPADGVDIVVDAATGSDAYTYAQVKSDPTTYKWATLGRAVWGSTNHAAPNSAQCAQPGDVVQVNAGTYDYAGTLGARLDPLYNPAVTGEAANPIEFRANGTVNITFSGTGTVRSVLGAENVSYIHWTGPFSINCSEFTWEGDRAPVVFWGAQGALCTGCKAVGLTLIGTDRTAEGNDNWSGVRFEYADQCTASDCTISGFIRGGSHGYGSLSYDSTNCTFENNDVSGCNGGIQIKGQHTRFQTGWVVRRNQFSSCTFTGIFIYGCQDGLFYQNTIDDCGFAVQFWTNNDLDGSNPGASGNQVINNTIYNATSVGDVVGGFAVKLAGGVATDFSGNVLANNIVHTVEHFVLSIDDLIPNSEFTGTASFNFKHNCYYSASGSEFNLVGGYTFAQWKATFGQDNAATVSLNVDPTLVDPANGDFKLDTGSPCEDAGLDVLNLLGGGTSAAINMGAYITAGQTDEIGPRA